MNVIQEIKRINAKEAQFNQGTGTSWHDDYKDSRFIFVGGLNYEMTEGDVLTVFSQFVHV